MAVSAETHQCRILVAVDDPGQRELMKDFLELDGHEVTASHSLSVPQIIEEQNLKGVKFDSMILSCMNGVGLIRDINGLGCLPSRVAIITADKYELDGQADSLREELHGDNVSLFVVYGPFYDVGELIESVNPLSDHIYRQPLLFNYP